MAARCTCPPSASSMTARRLASQVTVPGLPRSELAGLITEDSRWELLSRCLRDPGIPLDVRTAGALLLLNGQFVSRLTRLTAADIEQHGPDTCLRLDTVPVLLPPRLAALVRAQLDAAPAHSAPGCPGPRPLFPVRSPARPVAPQTLTRRLRQHGIEPRQARNSALAAWASDLPPRGPGQPARRPHPDRRELGRPHPPRLDHLHRRPGKHPRTREDRAIRISTPRSTIRSVSSLMSSTGAPSNSPGARTLLEQAIASAGGT
jgi:hypothetical protein